MTFLACFGAIFLLLAMVGGIGCAWIKLDEMRKNAAVRLYQSAFNWARLELAKQLRADSYWFSEDLPTMSGINLAAALLENPSTEVVREKWRKERKQAKEIEG